MSTFSISIPKPGGVVAAYGAVWVQSSPGGSLWKISPQGRVLLELHGVSTNPPLLYAGEGGGGIQRIATGFGSVWSLVGHNVLRIDPKTGAIVAAITVDRQSTSIASGLGSIWVDSFRASLQRIDPALNAVVAISQLGASPAALTTGEGFIWSLPISEAARVTKVDPGTGAMVEDFMGAERAFVVTSLGRVWTAAHEGYVLSFNAATGTADRARRIAQAITGITASNGIVWADAGDLVGIDGLNGRVLIRFPIAQPVTATAGIAVLGHQVWLAEPGLNSVVEVTIA